MYKKLYIAIIIGAAIGLISSFLQTLEVLELYKNQGAALYCNINSVFSCSTVLKAPQSSALGFPNAIMCLSMFLTFLVSGFAGLFGKGLNKNFRLTIQGLALFTLAFGIWYMWQSTYVIGALCIFCTFCMIGLLMVNAAWLRINANDLPYSEQTKKCISKQYDLLTWATLTVIGVLAIAIKFMS